MEWKVVENRLVLAYAFNPQKAPRPQDAVTALLGLAHPAYGIVRDRVILDPFPPTSA
jgi:hypothetical protein